MRVNTKLRNRIAVAATEPSHAPAKRPSRRFWDRVFRRAPRSGQAMQAASEAAGVAPRGKEAATSVEQDVADKDVLDKDINALNKAADVETEN